jgi:Flp pilus assembly pilin Flp
MTFKYFSTKRPLRAQGLVEYGIIIAFVALLCVGSLLMFRPALPSLLSTLAGSV